MPLGRRRKHDSDCCLPRSQRGITRENPEFLEEAEGPTFIVSKPPIITESTHKRLRCCGHLDRAGDEARPSRISDVLNNEKPAGVIARPLPAVLPRRACLFSSFSDVVSLSARGSKVDFVRVSAGAFRRRKRKFLRQSYRFPTAQVSQNKSADDKRTIRRVTRVLRLSP